MRKFISYITLLFLILSVSCTRQQMIEDTLTGHWNIAHYERTKIDTTGQRTVLLSEENVGRWSFYIDTIQAWEYTSIDNAYHLYGFLYDGAQGVQYDTGVVRISEEGRRFIIVGGNINTDIHYNIDEFNGKEMLISRYSSAPFDTAFFQLSIRLVKK